MKRVSIFSIYFLLAFICLSTVFNKGRGKSNSPFLIQGTSHTFLLPSFRCICGYWMTRKNMSEHFSLVRRASWQTSRQNYRCSWKNTRNIQKILILFPRIAVNPYTAAFILIHIEFKCYKLLLVFNTRWMARKKHTKRPIWQSH